MSTHDEWQIYNKLKKKVHPKMPILSSFTHPHVVFPNLYFFCEHDRYFEKCLMYFSVHKINAEVNAHHNCLVINILQNIFFLCKRKKCIQLWNDMRVSICWHIFHFSTFTSCKRILLIILIHFFHMWTFKNIQFLSANRKCQQVGWSIQPSLKNRCRFDLKEFK